MGNVSHQNTKTDKTKIEYITKSVPVYYSAKLYSRDYIYPSIISQHDHVIFANCYLFHCRDILGFRKYWAICSIAGQLPICITSRRPHEAIWLRDDIDTWWRHQMETFSALLAICAGNSPVAGEFPAQRPVTRSFDVFFDLRLNKRLSKQSWGWWFETLSRPMWRHCNDSLTNRKRYPEWYCLEYR